MVFSLSGIFGTDAEWDSILETNPRIQIADLVAREGMKELYRKIKSPKAQPRVAYDALNSGGYFRFVEWGEAYCIDWKEKIDKATSSDPTKGGFKEWLENTGRVQNGIYHDNPGTRLQYMIWFERSNPDLPHIFKDQ